MTLFRLLFCCLALGAAARLGAQPVPSAEPSPAKAADMIYPRASTLPTGDRNPATGTSASTGLLLTALALAVAGGWLYWRGRRTPGGGVALRHLSIAETKSLGNRQYLVVAAYQNKKFLLGVCPGRIDLLTPLDDTAVSRQP